MGAGHTEREEIQRAIADNLEETKKLIQEWASQNEVKQCAPVDLVIFDGESYSSRNACILYRVIQHFDGVYHTTIADPVAKSLRLYHDRHTIAKICGELGLSPEVSAFIPEKNMHVFDNRIDVR